VEEDYAIIRTEASYEPEGGVNWSQIFDITGLPQITGFVRGANLAAIVSSPHANKLLKFCTLLSTIININPNSISAMIEAEIPIGFSTDFYKKEVIQAYDMIYTKPQSVGMIVTPKPTDVTTLAGGDKIVNSLLRYKP
jgi:hypothetical protein